MPPIIPRLTSEQTTAAIVKTLRLRGVEKPERLLAKAKYIVLPWFQDSTFDVLLRLLCKKGKAPLSYLLHTIAEAIRDNASTLVGKGTVHSVRFFRYDSESDQYVSVRTDTPRPHPLGLNQCRRIPDRPPLIVHDRLRFRSKAEVAIHEELKQRDVLFFPCAAAVLGQSAAEYGAESGTAGTGLSRLLQREMGNPRSERGCFPQRSRQDSRRPRARENVQEVRAVPRRGVHGRQVQGKSRPMWLTSS